MTAALIVFSVFAGIAVVIATVAGCLLLANGKITLPGSNARRLQSARVDLEVARYKAAADRVREERNDEIDIRMRRALDPPKGDT
jgi:hypothetical protein